MFEMNKISPCFLFLVSFLFVYVSTYKSLQTHMSVERAVVKYSDPEYTKDTSTFTYRGRRGDFYKTNVTITILHPWTNNVTMLIYYKKGRTQVEHEVFRAGCCELRSIKWLHALMKKYTDIPFVCPIPQKTYHIINLVLLPNNFPIPLPEGDNYLGMKFVLSDNDRVLIDVQATIHVEWRK